MKPNSTLRMALSWPKDEIPQEKQVGVIYSIPCGECEVKYIGETSTALATRMKEHQVAARLNRPERSALAQHADETGPSINWNNASVCKRTAMESQKMFP